MKKEEEEEEFRTINSIPQLSLRRTHDKESLEFALNFTK